MSEPTAPPPPDPDPLVEPPPPEPSRRREWLPWLTGAGFLLVAIALLWVWQHPAVPVPSTAPADALAHQLGELAARVARLEQRPQPPPPDLGPLTARVTALEQRPASVSQAIAPSPAALDLSRLEARVVALEQRPIPNISPLEARIAGLESADRAALADLSRRLDAADAQVAASEKRARTVALVQTAVLALQTGQQLGDLPGAPPALARFAAASPPTDATLRLAFPPAAREAMAASHPSTEGKPLLTRMWAEAQELVTVRQGDRVLVGDPVAGVLERARAALDAGDLEAAVAETASLQGGAAQAMTGWLAQARSLLQARAALAAWAKSG